MLSGPLTIERRLLGPGYFSIDVSLCNFLGSCGRESASFTVTETETPFAVLFGPSRRVVRRFKPLQLLADASVSLCDSEMR